MDFELNEEQRMIRGLIERFAEDRYKPHHRGPCSDEAHDSVSGNWQLLADLGVLALPFSISDGGLGRGVDDIVVLMEAVGRGMISEPILTEILVAGALLANAGSAEQKAKWLKPMMEGKCRVGFSFAEHGARWTLSKADTRVLDGKISGSKTFAPADADIYIVTAADRSGVNLYLIDVKSAGVSRRNYRLIDGSLACELVLDAVPSEPLTSDPLAAEDIIDDARIAICAEMLGLMQALFDRTLGYVRERKQFGVPVGKFQAVQHRLVDRLRDIEQSRSLIHRGLLSKGECRSAVIAGMKSHISRAAIRVGEDSIQFHGGMGITNELDVGQGHKRLLYLSTLFGDADHELARYNRLMREDALH